MFNKSYKELIRLKTFLERFNYLKCNGVVGDIQFGGHRYLNQILYKTKEWKNIRKEIIVRDGGFDLAHNDYPIIGNIYVHHINPITIEDILGRSDCVFDPNNLISTSFRTHNAIHYGNEESLEEELVIRKPNDTCPWER